MSGTSTGARKREAKRRKLRPSLRVVLRSRIKVNSNGCWIWQGGTSNGYGYIDIDGKRITAHRASFRAFKSGNPKYVLHTCDVKKCIRPSHLYSGTNEQNSADFKKRHRGRFNRRSLKSKEAMTRFWKSMSKKNRAKFIDKRIRKQSVESKEKISIGLKVAYREGRR